MPPKICFYWESNNTVPGLEKMKTESVNLFFKSISNKTEYYLLTQNIPEQTKKKTHTTGQF